MPLDTPSKVARITLVMVLLLAWCAGPEFLGRSQAVAAPPDVSPAPLPITRPNAEEVKRISDKMERGFVALEAAAREIPRETFDPQAIVGQIGKDPVKLFEWVRDNTYWVPYRGVLRGPIGVLMDRVGNSADRGLLLAELLRVAGHRARLARAKLPIEQARQLLTKIREVPKDPLPRANADKKQTQALLERWAREYKLDPTALQASMEKASLRSASLSEKVAERVEEQSEAVLALIGKPDEQRIAERKSKDILERVHAVQDHWWVQRAEGDKWIDLDPLPMDAVPATVQGDGTKFIAFDAKTGGFALASDDCHAVTIRVVIEQWTKEVGLKERTVLQHTLRPFESLGQNITLRHYPMRWPRELNLFAEKEPLKKLKSVLLAENEWLPVLTVGPVTIAQSSFTATGDADPSAPGRVQSLVDGKGVGATVGGILGRGTIGGSDRPKSDGLLTAEWIEYRLSVPGQESRAIRRQIFDAIGPSKRANRVEPPSFDDAARLERATALFGQSEVLPVVCALSPEFVAHQLAVSTAANARRVAQLVRDGTLNDPKALAATIPELTPAPSVLYDLALVRMAWSRPHTQTFVSVPNVLTMHTRLRPHPDDELRLCAAIDIVVNDLSVANVTDPFAARVQQGILDTTAEAFVVGRCARPENTGEIFAAAQSQRVQWVVVRTPAECSEALAQLPADARARISADVAAGHVVLAPKATVTISERPVTAWWRIDAATGTTLGIGDNGWGQAATEQPLVLKATVFFILGATLFFFCVWATDRTAAARGIQRTMDDEIVCLIAGYGAAGALMTSPASWPAVILALLGMFGVGFDAGRD